MSAHRKVPYASTGQPSDHSASGVLSAANVDARINSLPVMNFSDLRQLWLNAMRFRGDPSVIDKTRPVERLLDAIETEWGRREVEGLIGAEDYFSWPTTDAPSAKQSSVAFEAPSQGVLSYLEYRCWQVPHGQTATVRRAILDRVFVGKLPPVFDRGYLIQWGQPGTAKRLRKIAESIAAFSRNFKRHEKESFEQAIQEWEADLQHLHDKYYVGKLHFAWPYTRAD